MATKPAPTPKSVKQDDPEQSKRFIETAKEIGATENEKEAEKAFRRVAKTQRPER
jgi:hypothetical protein